MGLWFFKNNPIYSLHKEFSFRLTNWLGWVECR